MSETGGVHKKCCRCPETRSSEFRKGDAKCKTCRRVANRAWKRELKKGPAMSIATLRAEVERSGDALAIERGLVTIYRNDVERHAQTIAALRDENARLKAELEQATRAIQGKALRKALTQRQEQSKP